MFVNYKIISSVVSLLCLLLFGQAHADDYVSGDKLSSLVIGKTIRAKHLKKDFEFTVYFDTDGKTAYRKQGGDITQTTYKFDGNKHCIHWKGKDRCAQILDNGDGTYTRVNKKGKQIVKWTKIESGKNL